MLKTVLIITGAVLLSIFKISLFSLLPFPLSLIDPLLVAVILTLFIFNFNSALGLALISGIILELFSTATGGVLSGALLLTVVAGNFLTNQVFTNRSLPALLSIGLSSTLAYKIILLIFYALASLKTKTAASLNLKTYLWATLAEIVFNTLVLAFIYLIIYKNTKKLDARFV